MLLINRKIKKIIASTLIFSFLSMNCSFAVETVITPTGQTATTVTPGAGGNFDIHTNTTVGDIGVNAFNKFDVGQGDTVNLHLNNEQNKLFNLIYDKSASQIDGVVNSYKNGAIGGNVLFANPNGFVIGEHGVFNVGSLTMITPTRQFLDTIFQDGGIKQQPLNDLISFSVDSDRVFQIRKNVQMTDDADIQIKGTINAQKGGIISLRAEMSGLKTVQS